jgi:hypothetical protein
VEPPQATTETRLARRLTARKSEPPQMRWRGLAVALPTLRRRAERRASRPRGRVPATMGVDAPGFKGDRPGVKDADWTLVWRVRAAVGAAPAEVTLGGEI